MNRFRTKKKAKENADEAGRPSHESDVSAMPALKPAKTFRRKKGKEEAEPKLELDLANALPPSDDFRTSLLMTGLSARFSMLREQDDPNSKIGKASDDSVLFPKRQSRLNDFGFSPRGLADIAEVGSIKESIRRPFALDRVDSFHSTDGYGTDIEGSIMARGKPAEGNNLFGGRQKIYKIPTSSSKNLNAAGEPTALGGRALYDDDVSQSAFQKLREREREERGRQDLLSYNQESQESSLSRPESPDLSGHNRNRETSSTTSSSGPYATRISTAATSFTSQRTPSVNGHSTPSTPAVPNQPGGGLERSFTKTKRLYETGLDQHLHTQQFSAVNRLDSLSRQGRNLGTRSPSPSPVSPDALQFDPSQQQFPPTRQVKAPQTSLPSPNAGFDFGVKPSAKDALRPYGITPPLSPPVSEGDEKSILTIQPNDKGKATALGSFSKPVHAYDERKYTQRQLQMQQGRETPPLRKHSPPQAFMPKVPNQEPGSRNRAESHSTYSSGRSRSSSSAQREFIPRERMFPPKRDPPPINAQGPSSGAFLSSDSDVASPRVSESDQEPVKAKQSAWEQASAYDEFQADMPAALHPSRKAPQVEHPALRRDKLKFQEHEKEDVEEAEAPSILVSKAPFDIDADSNKKIEPPADSPTLPPPGGLSGIIRQHLRSESNASSIGGGQSPRASSRFTTSDYMTDGNPWDGNDWEDGNINGTENKPHKAETSTNQRLTPVSNGFRPNQPTPRAVSEASDTPSWEKEISMHHSREGSTETQKERDDFANELAARRKRVQENLRNFAESDSRSQSPVRAPGMDSSTEGPFAKNGHLNFLKSKTSRSSLVGKQPKEAPPASQSKAMKMLGITSSNMINTPPAPTPQRYDDSQWKQEEEEMLRGVPQPSRDPPTKQFRQNRRDAQRERERQVMMRHRQGGGLESGDSDDHSRRPADHQMPLRPVDYGRQRQHPAMRTRSPSRDAPPVSFRRPRDPSEDSKPSTAANSRPGTRDRSSSDASGRSRSHNGRYRDDQTKAFGEALGDPTRNNSNIAAMNSPSLPPTGAVPPVPTSAPPARSRSASKSQVFPSHLDGHPSQLASPSPTIDNAQSRRPSPVAPFAVNPTPALSHPQPSPIASTATTPTTPQGFQSSGRIPAHRKRSINKSDISEPTLVSTTSRVTTVNLPTSPTSPASAPPLPPMDPRRRQTAKGMFSSWKSRKDEPPTISGPVTPTLPPHMQGLDEGGNFSADEAGMGRTGRRLRRSSSERGELNARARAGPVFTPGAGAGAAGGMF